MKDANLKSWSIAGNRVRLIYTDNSEFFVRKTDYDRAFGCIASGENNAIRRDFAIE